MSRIWRGIDAKVAGLSSQQHAAIEYLGYLSMEDKILRIDARILDHDEINIIIGLSTGEIILWKIGLSHIIDNSQQLEFNNKDMKHLVSHEGAVSDIKFNKTGSKVVCSGTDAVG